MIHRPELLDALQHAPSSPLSLSAWRHMFGGRRPDSENIGGARWNPPGTPAIYLSLSREGAIAEGDHALAVQPLRPRARRYVYEVTLTLERVLDLTADTHLRAVGLTPEMIGQDDHESCREVGGAVAWQGHDGLLIPSARSKASNLVVFPNNRNVAASFDHGHAEEVTGA